MEGVKLRDIEPLEGYHHEIGLLLSAIHDSTREWRENLDDLPIEAVVWQPAPDAYSIGALILHIVDCEDYWLRTFAGGHPRDPEEGSLFMSDETNQYDGIWPVPPAQPLRWYFDLHDRIRTRAFEALKGIEPTRRFDRPKTSYTLRWIVAHILEHDSYTGGQAVAIQELWKKSASSPRP